MSTRIPPDQIFNLQQIEAVVAGPDGANRLYTITGQIGDGSRNLTSQLGQETFSTLLGPVFARSELIRAIASASISGAAFIPGTSSGIENAQWHFADIGAVWDDDTGQVQLVIGVAFADVSILAIGFTVTILAEMAP